MLRVWRAYRVRVVHAAMPRADVVRVLCAGACAWYNTVVVALYALEFGCTFVNQLLCGHRQVVRQWLPKPSCAGSNPVARSIIAIKEKRCMRVYARSSAFLTAWFTRLARSNIAQLFCKRLFGLSTTN